MKKQKHDTKKVKNLPRQQKLLQIFLSLPKYSVMAVIRVYQKLFSFDHSFWANPQKIRVCIYEPSCSEYTYQAIDRFGLIKGSILGTRRVISCNPFNDGGYDPVPEKFTLRPQAKHNH